MLRHHDYGEADRLLTLYTRQLGKTRALAKGARKIASRKAGHIDPFTHVKLQLAKGRDMLILTQADTVDAYQPLREDLILTSHAAYVLELLDRFGPDGIARELNALSEKQPPSSAQPLLPRLVMPVHHDVRAGDVVTRRLRGSLVAAASAGPTAFRELLLVPGVGARTIRALAMVAEAVHGAPCRFSDPARFSFAHGGKDRHPFPVPLHVYDETIRVLKSAVHNAKLGHEEELGAIKRLDQQARQLEAYVKAPAFETVLAEERRNSASYGGRSVFGPDEASVSERRSS